MSHFDKPKVTIDLNEYNQLQQYKERFEKSKVSEYQKAIVVLLKLIPGKGDIVKSNMQSAGLRFTHIVNNGMDHSDIYIETVTP